MIKQPPYDKLGPMWGCTHRLGPEVGPEDIGVGPERGGGDHRVGGKHVEENEYRRCSGRCRKGSWGRDCRCGRYHLPITED